MRIEHGMRRGTPDHDLARTALGPAAKRVADGQARRINGRYLKAAFIQRDRRGRLIVIGDEIAIRWKRVGIPKNHPWRGKRPTTPETPVSP